MEPAEYEQRVATLEGSMTTMAQTVERVSKTVGEVNKKVEQLTRDMPTYGSSARKTGDTSGDGQPAAERTTGEERRT